MYLKNAFIQSGKNVFIRFPKKLVAGVRFLREFYRFRTLVDKRFTLKARDFYPCLTDRIKYTPFDQHYIYHPAWAARKLANIKPSEHIDISSILSFATIVSAFIPVRFYDYRPAGINLSNLTSGTADLSNLSFADESVESLSCMHTIEHIGLGRYGDTLDPKGDLKAIAEIKRVLRKGGHVLFVTPVGKPKIEYNAHRIYSYEQIMDYFSPLVLEEFALVPDKGGLIEHADPTLVKEQHYGCGCFLFRKKVEL